MNGELTRERAEELLKRSSLFTPGSPQATLTAGVNTGEMADAFYSQVQASRTLARLGRLTLKPKRVKGIVPGVSLPRYQVELTPNFKSKAQAEKWKAARSRFVISLTPCREPGAIGGLQSQCTYKLKISIFWMYC